MKIKPTTLTPEQQAALNTVKTMIETKKAPSNSYNPPDGLDRMRICNIGVKESNQRFARRGPDGERVIERRPARASAYSQFIDPNAPLDTESDWYETICDQHGHVVFQTMTSSCARVMTKGRFIKDETHQAALIKRRYFGWFPLKRCPIELVQSDELLARHMLTPIEGAPCAPGTFTEYEPCVHARAEIAARRARNAEVTAKIEAQFAPEDRDMKIAEAAAAAAARAIAGTRKGK